MGTSSDFLSVQETILDGSKNGNLSYSHAGLDAWTDKTPGESRQGDFDHGSAPPGRIYAVHDHPTKPGEVRPCDHCGVGGRLAQWDWPGRAEPVWLHEKCEADFAAANTAPPTAPNDYLGIPEFLRRPFPAAAKPNGRAPALGPTGAVTRDDLK